MATGLIGYPFLGVSKRDDVSQPNTLALIRRMPELGVTNGRQLIWIRVNDDAPENVSMGGWMENAYQNPYPNG